MPESILKSLNEVGGPVLLRLVPASSESGGSLCCDLIGLKLRNAWPCSGYWRCGEMMLALASDESAPSTDRQVVEMDGHVGE